MTGFTTPEVPRICSPFEFCLFLSFTFFLPSLEGGRELSEKQLRLFACASHGQTTSTCWPCVASHLDWVYFGPRCINRLVSQSHGWSAQGDQAKGSLLGLGVKGGHSRGDSEL
ncbi:hypothetical protein AVEN_28108-1 [Araneus ventricosus]|uniref:Uncharacterized protein n=1 Tax=Araneus ventricosus TaxID=182803 RepID=A0A4Y2MKW6_ARAVE|nr:hypothetical protein AVEN_28108-1 [Araneus ventricosus]